ncbi:MAG: menaquinone biosynthesis protein [Saprospiraceae bacterium]|nr:menaquinone biosynthesis protein [Saprospiraceae bacterium]
MAKEKFKVTAVSYLNTKPLLYGLFKSRVSEKIDLQLDIPSVCAQKLERGEADLGLVPVAIIPELSSPRLVSDYCIGTVGAVKTVCIYAEQPLEQLEAINLDYHSRTSVELVKILLEKYWKLSPQLLPAAPGFEQQIQGKTGALVIGDRTIGLDLQYPYVYDLGAAWMAYTGLPFVFAAWVSNKPLPEDFIAEFNEALHLGIEAIPELIYLIPRPHPQFDLQDYYTQNISYQLDDDKRKALKLFLSHLSPHIFDTSVLFQKSAIESL